MFEPVEKERKDYTEGSITSSIVKMGLPSMFGFLSQNIYSLVDTFWVSRLPEKESGVAAVTFFATILWLFFSFNQLVGPGSVAIISRRYGEKDYDNAEKAIKETLFLKLFFGILFGIVGYFFVDRMLLLMGAEGLALTEGIAYGQVMFIGMPIMFATYSIYTAMRGVANPQMAMYLMIASNLMNLILDPIIMFGYFGLPALGIRGAAIASVASFTLTLAVGLLFFYGDFTNVRLHLRGKVAMSAQSMWKMVKIGVPAWFGDMSFSGARLVITPLIAAFGTKVVAAYGVGNQVTHFGIMILVGIGLGLSSLIGHNLGGKKFERAKKTADQSILLGTAIMLVFGILNFVFAESVMRLFFESDDTVRYGVIMLRIFAISFPFIGVFIMVSEIHVGVGLNTPAMVVSIVHSWLLEVLPIIMLTQFMSFDQNAIWWTISAAGIVSSIIFYAYYRRGRWLTVEV
ncbi:MAG: MATE family efflux transporter [Candidatus Zixiibacteriota bacterium]